MVIKMSQTESKGQASTQHVRGNYLGLGYELLTIEQIEFEIYAREPYDLTNDEHPKQEPACTKPVGELVTYNAGNADLRYPKRKHEPAYCKYCTEFLIERTGEDPCHSCHIGYREREPLTPMARENHGVDREEVYADNKQFFAGDRAKNNTHRR
jgi:hypothetical protein